MEKQGYRKRTIYLLEDLDKQMRVVAAKDDMSYSEAAIAAFEQYLKRKK